MGIYVMLWCLLVEVLYMEALRMIVVLAEAAKGVQHAT